MTAQKFPTLFVSHGAPNLVLHHSPAREFLGSYGKELGRPKAILVLSAHFETRGPALTADAHPEMIYDFGGFERELYAMQYPAPGAPDLATRAASLLKAAGHDAREVSGRGFDHGTWVPLMLLYPNADIPVVQLSVQRNAGAAHHIALGRALTALREEGVLIIGSGGVTHNLMAFFNGNYAQDAVPPDWVADFDTWVHQKATTGDAEALVQYRQLAPHAKENHPSEEHFLPLPFALGAAGAGAKGQRIHTSHEYGVLMMDAYMFA
jgi:4,5-DOPA dioxygenase extradiol